MTSVTGSLLVAMLQETGHLNPSFKLMRSLKARGHDVRYLATPALAPLIEAQGFPVVPFFPDLKPAERQSQNGKLGLLYTRRAITRHSLSEAERLCAGGENVFGGRPRALLVDVTQTQLSLWARAVGIPQVLLNTSLPQTKAPGVPPLRSGLSYDPSPRGKLRAELAWQRFLLKRKLSARAAALVGMCPPYALSQALAARFGVSADELDYQTVYMPQLRGLPEMVFCAQELDFPRPVSSLRHYVESVDLARHEAPFDFSLLPSDKPLVYCALGSQLYRAGDTPGFFQRLLQAFAQRPQLQLLLATGNHMRPEALTPPSNVVVVERAPQLAVLRRAQLMITHGGLGSVKECVLHGVPMLVFPLDVDQPGNAARVRYHGLGLSGDIAQTSVPELLHMLDRVLSDASFAQHSKRLQTALRQLEDSATGADTLERMLSTSAQTLPSRVQPA